MATPQRAKANASFFKTGEGQYGAGDTFIGVTVPEQRRIARAHRDLPIDDIATLLESDVHEHRLTAALILVLQFERPRDPASRKQIYDFYMRSLDRINNWDIVDSSAPQIAGAYLLDKKRTVLHTLARSRKLWRRRVAIVATQAFIRAGDLDETFALTEALMNDREDLIHKACGWTLREAGKKDRAALTAFLDRHHASMPRTMLRYAIEHYDASERAHYMHG